MCRDGNVVCLQTAPQPSQLLLRTMSKNSIVRIDRFIQATRDSGYRGTVLAVAELVDNSIQAGASRVSIMVEGEGANAERVSVADDGVGMCRRTLKEALRFGGSSRFNSRKGMGRFGMGLPNASLSQARRVDVFTWQDSDAVLHSYLDVDAIASKEVRSVPEPSVVAHDENPWGAPGRSGTVVRWEKLDRLDNKRTRTIERKLHVGLGRIFRHLIWRGAEIDVNSVSVTPVDPLFLADHSVTKGGELADEWSVEVSIQQEGSTSQAGTVSVRFSILPVEKWYSLSKSEKRARGVTNGAGVSVVRAGREVDYGWFFLRGKRRQNYDDWWRCEVSFEPELDEAFGISHTKQEIRPSPELREALCGYMVETASMLHAEVRRRYARAKGSGGVEPLEKRAQRRDKALPPLPAFHESTDRGGAECLERAELQFGDDGYDEEGPVYRMIEADLDDGVFFTPVRTEKGLVVALSPSHPFHSPKRSGLISPQADSGVSATLKAVMLAAARADAMFSSAEEKDILADFRRHWSDALREFLT